MIKAKQRKEFFALLPTTFFRVVCVFITILGVIENGNAQIQENSIEESSNKIASIERRLNTTKQYSRSVNIVVTDEGVSDEVLKISPSMTLVWLNAATLPIRITFPEQGVSTTCRAARGFVIESQGISHSEVLYPGDVASLCLLKKGKLHYLVRYYVEGMESDTILRSVEGLVKVE